MLKKIAKFAGAWTVVASLVVLIGIYPPILMVFAGTLMVVLMSIMLWDIVNDDF